MVTNMSPILLIYAIYNVSDTRLITYIASIRNEELSCWWFGLLTMNELHIAVACWLRGETFTWRVNTQVH